MEKGQPVWLKSSSSQWGWVPALVHNREEVTIKGITVLKVTLRDDPSAGLNGGGGAGGFREGVLNTAASSYTVTVGAGVAQLTHSFTVMLELPLLLYPSDSMI